MSEEKSFHPTHRGPSSGDWYGFGSVFVPREVAFMDGGSITGLRMLTAVDVVSVRLLATRVVEKRPGPVYASRLIPFVDSVCDSASKPAKGIVISHSCWLSSDGLESDPDTAEQGQFLRQAGISFDAMPDREKLRLQEWGKSVGLVVLFDADDVF